MTTVLLNSPVLSGNSKACKLCTRQMKQMLTSGPPPRGTLHRLDHGTSCAVAESALASAEQSRRVQTTAMFHGQYRHPLHLQQHGNGYIHAYSTHVSADIVPSIVIHLRICTSIDVQGIPGCRDTTVKPSFFKSLASTAVSAAPPAMDERSHKGHQQQMNDSTC